MYVFNLNRIEHSIIVYHFRQYLAGITDNFCSNNSDGRIWAFYSTYLTLDRDNHGIGLIHFVRKLLFLLKWTVFLAGSITFDYYLLCFKFSQLDLFTEVYHTYIFF